MRFSDWQEKKHRVLVTFQDADAFAQIKELVDGEGVILEVHAAGLLMDFRCDRITGEYFLPWHAVFVVALLEQGDKS